MDRYDLIIMGAGAAGLMCAGTAAMMGKSVLVLDHAEKAGKKILISGGGRCNFTNRFASASDYVSANAHFCKSALARFSAADFIDMVERAGIAYHERKHGQLFCDKSAKDMLEMLLAPCRASGVNILLQTEIHTVEKKEQFQLSTSRGAFCSNALVVATGGLSIPKMGASAFGLKIAESFALNVITPSAGLVPFTFTGREKERLITLAGISLDVTLHCHGHSFSEAMLFTHRGLSGPAVLQASSFWQLGDSISIDLLPQVDVAEFLTLKRQQRPQAQLSTLLAELLPKRLVQLLLEDAFSDVRLNQIGEKQLGMLNKLLHGWQLKPNGTEGYRTAEVTMGGVDTDELSSKTMQCKRVDGLYFIGEVVDVTGALGGFNFQWAWSSGYAAAMAIAER
ncbi:MAG: NAD(P)/FAD-dependent oxidoreductase [Mariprofundus sp.]|nr:NAD(P)/FAD-dependent oxidoreductase [Mariprofundus sp.]